jgi:hypothetical protein
MKFLTCATILMLALAPSYGFGQAPMGHGISDDELIKLSLSAAPQSIAKDATVIAMGADGKMRTLHQGTGQWTCMPGHADPSNPDPMCGDANAMEWAGAWMAHKKPPANKVGFMYMLRGDGGASNTDPYAMKQTPDNSWVKTGTHHDRWIRRQNAWRLSENRQGRSDETLRDVARHAVRASDAAGPVTRG